MPQAICTRYGLSMGAKAAPIVRVLLVLFFPVAYPISKVRTRAQMLLLFATIWEQLAIILVVETSGPPQLFIIH
jgi:hypothetical protein